MSRRVLVVHPDSSTKHIAHSDAVSLVERGQGRWYDESHKRVDVLPNHLQVRGRLEVRGLSARYGEDLAVRYQSREEMAQVIVAHIRMQRESPSYAAV